MQPYQDGIKRYDHPDVGRLSFEYNVLNVTDERYASLNLVTYVPLAGTDTREKLEALLEPAVAMAGPDLESAMKAAAIGKVRVR